MVAPLIIGSGITFEGGIAAGNFIIPAPNSLVAYYNAGDSISYPGTGTTWYDRSGQGNDLTFQGSSISYTSSGAASYFTTGSNGFFNRLNATNLPIGNDNYTFALWVNNLSWNSSGLISIGSFGVPNQSNALRTTIYPNLLNYWWGNDLGTGTSAPNPGWFYVVAKFDGTTRSIWVDGVVQGSDTPGSSHNVISSTLQVGQTQPGEYLNGDVGQVWIYNFAVSDSDILANFNATRSIYGV